MALTLTEKLVKGLLPPVRGNRIHYDAEITGFGCRVTAAGSRSFVFNFTINGRERRKTIGSWPAWSVQAAREEARALRRQVDVGADPLSRRDAERAAPTMAELAGRYVREHATTLRAKTHSEYESMTRIYIVPEFGPVRVNAVTTEDVRRLHDRVKARHPVRANRVVSLVAAMIDWGGAATGTNPARGVKLAPEEERERFLSQDEVARLCDAIDGLSDPRSADGLRLLLATGARKMEVLRSRWREFDLAARTWVKPAAHMKAKRRHPVPLSDGAVALLLTLREEAGAGGRAVGPDDHVLPGAGADGHLGDVKRAWRRATEAAGLGRCEDRPDSKGRVRRTWVPDARVHDLRHTFASFAAAHSHSLQIVGRLLGQSRLTSAARYAHLADPALRSAANHAGGVALGGRPRGSREA